MSLTCGASEVESPSDIPLTRGICSYLVWGLGDDRSSECIVSGAGEVRDDENVERVTAGEICRGGALRNGAGFGDGKADISSDSSLTCEDDSDIDSNS